MAQIMRWDSVSRDGFTWKRSEVPCATLAYSLTRLPDFSKPRFAYLGKDVDARPAEVAKLQQQMLRQLHGLGPGWGISMRVVKDRDLSLYLVFRQAAPGGVDSAKLERLGQFIRGSLMGNEYSFESMADPSPALDVSWAREVAEVFKREGEFHGVDYPTGDPGRRFYAPFMWQPTDNTMKYVCDALMNLPGRACVEVTLVPTTYLDDERDWVNVNISSLRDCMNGETIRDANNRIIWQGEKLPALKPVVDNCEKANTQYEGSRVFLSSIHVFAEHDADFLTTVLLANSVRNPGECSVFSRGTAQFRHIEQCYRSVDVTVDIVSSYWTANWRNPEAPFRAQRLSRLVSVEEAGNFFRIPMPQQSGFPGFGLDTGLGASPRSRHSSFELDMGHYLDVAGVDDHAEFSAQQLAKHGLIVGVPGSGKTTAMFSILHQLWDAPADKRIPFIVLEPAKTEYRSLKCLPAFERDMLVFTLGDEDTSPFRFNPLEVLPGIRLENHISKLQACFVGAFDLFDPLPIFLEQAIRRTYLEKGWYDDSRGGDPGLVTPTLTDLCRNAEYIVENSGFDPKMKSDFKASLLERLNSLRRGSKGRMLDCKHSIPMEDLMGRPVILELDSLNGDEKSLMMMFLLSYVFEYCKVRRTSGSPLRHLLVVEEAHNLISSQGTGGENRANPKMQTIELFVNMLAEMRALGQGILIADQLPTAIAPQAVKQTNVKILMRVTARDDREEMGATMDLDEDQMHQVVNFKTGHAYLYHEGEDHVRMVRLPNFKGEHDVEEPPTDARLKRIMGAYELEHLDLYRPFAECSMCCGTCDRRTRNQAESLVRRVVTDPGADVYKASGLDAELARAITFCGALGLATTREKQRIEQRYGSVGPNFGSCVYIHALNLAHRQLAQCKAGAGTVCGCTAEKRLAYLERFGTY